MSTWSSICTAACRASRYVIAASYLPVDQDRLFHQYCWQCLAIIIASTRRKNWLIFWLVWHLKMNRGAPASIRCTTHRWEFVWSWGWSGTFYLWQRQYQCTNPHRSLYLACFDCNQYYYRPGIYMLVIIWYQQQTACPHCYTHLSASVGWVSLMYTKHCWMPNVPLCVLVCQRRTGKLWIEYLNQVSD